ncbi:MAG: DUF1501 domain-containing protein [Planctomycetes bacterium]|nr:DUF1501 domain-containing protein [Planctomycetota bacterium]MCB9909879.1 DUF1501 domain-containing protein [Planctomycetota bacterium]MCB9913381.1 DUF1501 domain-containing protein [Planctomycetota bacterium]HPF14034.1 DUF1501 domain-containing protein [Planctomycetota bacterium]HRV80467.1 DUF1501 domain-containing protein [Planctomycetota bacterium]
MNHRQPNGRVSRRTFLQASAALAATGLVQAWPLARRDGKAGKLDRTLIMIELKGGNDGLSMVIPTQDPNYLRARSTALVRPDEALVLDPTHGFHPGLAKLALAFRANQVAILEGVGVPGGVRSHFRATDIWHSADPVRAAATPGWIARLGDMAWPDRGSDAVVHFGSDPLGAHFSPTRSPLAVENPDHFATMGEGPRAVLEGQAKQKGQAKPSGNAALDRIRQLSKEASKESLRVRAATAGYRTPVAYPKTPLGQSARDICAMLNFPDGAPPRVLSAAVGGFDTHAREKNAHDRQMVLIDEALGALLQDLGRTEIGREAVVLVYSEFGRRVNENGSQGTDHGKGGPSLILGHNVQGGIFGPTPSLTDLDEGDLKVTIDFRSIYATLIEGLFDQDSERLLGAKLPKLEFLG